jgi:hypothetical protein
MIFIRVCVLCFIYRALQSAAIWTNLGLFYLHHDDPELGNNALYRAQILDPEFSLAWVGQAFVAIANGHAPETRALLEHAITLSPPIVSAERSIAIEYLSYALPLVATSRVCIL